MIFISFLLSRRMVDFSVPSEVKRGEKISGSVYVKTEEIGRARKIVLYFENRIQYPNPCKNNFSSWGYTKEFPSKDAKINGNLPFEYVVPVNAPPTYNGQALKSKWFVKVKIDIPFWFDKNIEKEVVVKR